MCVFFCGFAPPRCHEPTGLCDFSLGNISYLLGVVVADATTMMDGDDDGVFIVPAAGVAAVFLRWSSVRNRFVTLKEKENNNDGGRSLKRSRTKELGTIKIEWSDCVKTGQK